MISRLLLLITICVALQDCSVQQSSDSQSRDVAVYDLKAKDINSPQIEIQNSDEIFDILSSQRLTDENEVKVKIYPTYEIDLLSNGKVVKTLRVSGNIIIHQGKAYRVRPNVEEYIASHILSN